MTKHSTKSAQDLHQVLTFKLGEDRFAIAIESVHEILDAQTHTKVPNADAFAPGVVNVRGTVVPVVDIRNRLQMPPLSHSDDQRMIVFELPIDGSPQTLAFGADLVEQVTEVDASAIEPVPELGAVWPQAYLWGAVRHNDERLILLNVETLFQPTRPKIEGTNP
jgi:purine-binding chemotaxis protein CheW